MSTGDDESGDEMKELITGIVLDDEKAQVVLSWAQAPDSRTP